MSKRIKIEENRTQENDGFSSSDGEFDKEVERTYSLSRRVQLLRNQITREKKEHAAKIEEKDEEIRNLKKRHASEIEEKDEEIKNLKKEHANEIKEKDADVKNLKAEVLKQDKKNIQTEERNLELEKPKSSDKYSVKPSFLADRTV